MAKTAKTAKTAKELAKDVLAKQNARKIESVKKRPTAPPTKTGASISSDLKKRPTSRGMSAIAAPLTPNRRMSSDYDAATPLPRKSGKAKKGYSINNVMCSHTRKK